MKVGQYLRWAPFIVAVLLGLIVAFDRTPEDPAATLVGQLFTLLPIAAMVAAGGTRSRRGALGLVAATVAAMIVLDLAPLRDAGSAGPAETISRYQDGNLRSSGYANGWLTPGALGRALRLMPEGAFLRGNGIMQMEAGSTLSVASWTMLKLSCLLLPFGLIGWALGLESWIRKRVTFRHRRDEYIARVVLDVGLATFLIWFAFNTGSRSMVGVVRGDPVWTIAIPFLLVVAAGLPGWLQKRSNPIDAT